MFHQKTLVVLLALVATPAPADPPSLAFKPAGPGLYQFNTGPLQGRLKLDGTYQGLHPARAHCRLAITRNLSDAQAVERYEAYLKEIRR